MDQEGYVIEREQNTTPQHVQYPIANYERDIDLQEDIDNGWEMVDNDQVPDYCHFIGNEGLNMNTTSRNPEDFFNNLFDDRMYTIIAEETNNYAWQQIIKTMGNRNPFEHMDHYNYQRYAHLHTWKDLNSSDIKMFIKLRPILTAAHKSENYKEKCQMDGTTLVIKARNYNMNNLHTLPLEINGFHTTSKIDSEKNVIGFFGELNPLSNFHPAPFKINGQAYHSSEQYIQHQKCLVFGDKEAADSVLKAETTIDCKNIGRDIKNFERERWKQNAKARCLPGILAKFEQNPLLSELLKSTGNKTIVESC